MKEFKCTECDAHRFCRSKSISKGSRICDEKRGRVPPRLQKGPSDAEKTGLLWALINRARGKK